MEKSIPKCGKSERLQVLNQEKMDRISSLPDEILCHILSFLPIKCAVQTCILSSRWKHLWTSLPCLCFDDSLWFKDKRPGESTQDVLTRFANFVNKVLLFHSADINKFSVHCSEPNIYLTDLPPLKSWVSSAIERNVGDIELNHVYVDVLIELPDNICTCKTLEMLKLKLDFDFKIPTSRICFPSLKCLHAEMYYPHSTCITEKLFTICPVLEDLLIEIHLEDKHSVTNLNISSLTLKRLTLSLEKVLFSNTKHQVMIRAPNLEHLCIYDDTLVSYMVHELHSLTEVHFDIEFDKYFVEDLQEFDPPNIPADRMLQLLKGITNTRFLSLSAGIISALDCAFEDYIPTFPYLTYLKVEIEESGFRLLPIILRSLPNLGAMGT
ncbi:F-box/LRR-repeat protein At4g14103 isoform X3 [Citrus sinensis]|uniref:F-box/LRR-repeat protein At4g14103 isoform X3 n=1 Tax=Citrus sinensis TaxID=2711 RepID=UPI0007635E95|nr:F-box/LRR-repeat protein At4g14103 isoform X3 [Citrus sinensis]XP_024037303.1 F-box/LRR-repeat protein At4g14103 isoform X2 [Citrus x clementina]